MTPTSSSRENFIAEDQLDAFQQWCDHRHGIDDLRIIGSSLNHLQLMDWLTAEILRVTFVKECIDEETGASQFPTERQS